MIIVDYRDRCFRAYFIVEINRECSLVTSAHRCISLFFSLPRLIMVILKGAYLFLVKISGE